MRDTLNAQFGGKAVRFTTDSPAILNALSVHFKHCLVGESPFIADFQITAINETVFCVAVDGSVLYPRLVLGQVLQVLMQDGLSRLIGETEPAPVFHAAALADARGGVILCGPSGSGKSSLAAWLLATGYRYLTDEAILYSDDLGQISGFARSLVLKKGSAFIWRHFLGEDNREGLLHFSDGSAWLDPCLLSPNGFCPQAAPRLLLFPRYTPGANLCLTSLTPAESLFLLLQTLVNARNLPDSGLGSAVRLARRAAAYRLEFSDLETAAAWIRQA